MTNCHCDSNCRISRGGAGPWDDQMKNFSNIKQAHRNCSGFQIGEPKLKGKKNWDNTEIEHLFTGYFNKHVNVSFKLFICLMGLNPEKCVFRQRSLC